MDEVNEKIKNDCIERWGKENSDERIERFVDIYARWIESIPVENRELIYKLIEKFEYYGHSYVNKKLSELHNDFISQYNIDNDETLYTYIEKSDSIISSSIEYMLEYKMINNISKKNYCINIKEIKKYDTQYIKNIVLVDDYSGTGESIIKYLNKNLKLFKGKNIYILLISISRDAIINIQNEFEDKDIKVYINSSNVDEKAFLRLRLNEEETIKKRDEFELISKQKGIMEDIWGKGNAEGLVSFYNNTPNDTLGIFWKETNENEPLFPRNNDIRPKWRKMKKNRKYRKFQNANNFRRNENG